MHPHKPSISIQKTSLPLTKRLLLQHAKNYLTFDKTFIIATSQELPYLWQNVYYCILLSQVFPSKILAYLWLNVYYCNIPRTTLPLTNLYYCNIPRPITFDKTSIIASSQARVFPSTGLPLVTATSSLSLKTGCYNKYGNWIQGVIINVGTKYRVL